MEDKGNMKNKIIGIIICMLLIFSTTTLAMSQGSKDEQQKTDIPLNTTPTPLPSTTFTHTVFCEFQTQTTCPNCPMTAEALKNIYNSSDYPFYYVSLVLDVNPNAKARVHQYNSFLPAYIATPTVYFDGGDNSVIGKLNSTNAMVTAYRELIEEEGNRSVMQPIELSSKVDWLGDGKITVTVTIKNNGNAPYLGKGRSYVTEIVSRWKDTKGKPFSFGFLDFAIDTVVFIPAGETKNISAQWDATQAHGQNFGNISKTNIMVMTTISNWIPHYRTGFKYQVKPNLKTTQRYLAYYVDQTTAAAPMS
jgi:hypothetical protein